MRLTVTIDGTVHEAEVTPGDIMAFEDKYSVSFASLYVPKRDPDTGLVIRDAEGDPETEPGPAFRTAHVYYLAWNVLHRTGQTTDDFDTWKYTVGDLEAVPEVPLESTPVNS